MSAQAINSKARKQDLIDSLQYQKKLNQLYNTLHEAESFEQVLPILEKEILALLDAERMTVYQRGRHDREIVSKYKTGEEIKEIRVPLSPSSISGYVALSKTPVLINDVYNQEELASINDKLHFDQSHDQRSGWRTRSMVVVPIEFKKTLLGVLQILNKKNGGAFNQEDLERSKEIAHIIAQKFQYDFEATQGPFDYLLQRRFITREQLDELTQKAKSGDKSLPYLLISEMKLAPEEVGESLERYYQVPFFKYDPGLQLPEKLCSSLNRTYLKSSLWVPVSGDQDKAVVLIDDPNDSNRIMEIQQILNARSYEFRVGIKEDILSFLDEEETEAASLETEESNLNDLVGRLELDRENIQEEYPGDSVSGINENESTVIQLVNRLISEAHQIKASDIHIEPGKDRKSADVRMRVDGVCRKMLQIPATHIRAVIARIKILSRLDISERRKPQDGKISAKIKGNTVELRVATIPTVNGEGAVLRLLPSGEAMPLEKINLSENNFQNLTQLISNPHGIFLVVGPTGSGKTTTLHAILRHINSPDRKIWTAEDPVEITQEGLQQVQVHPQIDFTFAAAMRSFLRADPDVILIGETRDRETSQIATEASLTGHLVFSTLHTNSAPETITRLLGLGLEPMDFAEALLGVLAQRLVRTLCDKCKQPYKPENAEIVKMAHLYNNNQDFKSLAQKYGVKLYKAVGCPECGNTGYKGRTGIHELLVATPAMKRLVGANKPVYELRNKAKEQGMKTLMQDGIEKIFKGQTDLTQLRRVTTE